MVGAIIGDIVGSRFEHHNYKSKNFTLDHPDCRFTDDTVLTVAITDALLNGGDYAATLKDYYRRYPSAGYGQSFAAWAQGSGRDGYGSFGNGSAMRVSAVGWFCNDLEQVFEEAARSAAVTHNHPEGIKGAQATAAAVFLTRQGYSKAALQESISRRFGYDLERTPDAIRPTYRFDVSCQGSVPEAICCYLHAENFTDTLRTAVSIGGDSDTITCIAGSISAAVDPIPRELADWALGRLDNFLHAKLCECLARLPEAAGHKIMTL